MTNLPELPRIWLDSSLASTPVTGPTITVRAGQSFQAALDQIDHRGGEIVLEAGATFDERPYELRPRIGNAWLVIRPSNMDALPPEGVRMTPEHATSLPKILQIDANPAITIPSGANFIRFMGVEMTLAPSCGVSYGIVGLGSDSVGDPNAQPSDIIFDRSYLHGHDDAVATRRAVAMNGRRVSVVDSYLSNFHDGADAQALMAWNSPGPFKIVNSYLEATGENFMCGGAPARNSSLNPADIEFRGNHCYKPNKWRVGHPAYAGVKWTVKNLFELKNAQRVLVEGNVFDNTWIDGQDGKAILFTRQYDSGQEAAENWNAGGLENGQWVPRHDITDDATKLADIADVTFRFNTIRNARVAFSMSGDYIPRLWADKPCRPISRVLLEHTQLENVQGFGSLGNAVNDLTVRYNANLNPKASGVWAFFGPDDVERDMVCQQNLFGVTGLVCTGDRVGGNNNVIRHYCPPLETSYQRWSNNVFVDLNGPEFSPITLVNDQWDYHMPEGNVVVKAYADVPTGDHGPDYDTLNRLTDSALTGNAVGPHPAPLPTPSAEPPRPPAPVPVPTPGPTPPPQPTPCVWTLDRSSEVVPAEGATFTVRATPSAPGCPAVSVSAIPGVPPIDWATWQVQGELVTFTVVPNTTGTQRYTAVSAGGQSFTILQGAGAIVVPFPGPPPPPPPPPPPTYTGAYEVVVVPSTDVATDMQSLLSSYYAQDWRVVASVYGLLILEREHK